MKDSFEAYISYRSSFSLDGKWPDGVKNEIKTAQVDKLLTEAYGAVRYTPESAETVPVFRDIRTTMDFLHGGKLPFEHARWLLPGLDVRMTRIPLETVGALLTFFPEFNVAQLCLCFKGTGLTTDQLIFARQSHGGAAVFREGGRETSLDGCLDRLAAALGCAVGSVERTYLVEIKDFGGAEDVEKLLTLEKQRIYGLMTGDEGWAFVPEELAAQRMANSWGSRSFVRVISFGNNAVLLNLTHSAAAAEYRQRQEQFGGDTYGGVNPYFLVDSDFAGLDHGIWYAQELVMVLKTISTRILHRKSSVHAHSGRGLHAEIVSTKQFRRELISTLNQVENLGISELGELEQMLLKSHRISPLIDDIRYLMELLESDLNLLYQQSTNRLVNMLTIIGLLLTFGNLLLSIFLS